MADLGSYHVPEGSPKQVAEINLAARLKEAEEAAKKKPAPKPTPAPPPKAPPKPSHVRSASSNRARPVIIAAVTAVVLLAALAAFASDRKPSKPASVPTQAPRTGKPGQLPAVGGTVPEPAETPAPAPAAAGTYTVEPGDTLITIGERLGKDWQAIANANGVTDPTELHAGQVLTIP